MIEWNLRPAGSDDLEPLVEIRAAAMRPDLERLGRYDPHRVRQRFRDAYEPRHTRVIESSGTLVGCVSLRPDPDAHWLEHFYLSPAVHGAGIGTAVLRDLLARCDRDATRVRLNVLQGSPARRLYERVGFTLETQDPVDVFMLREPCPGRESDCAPSGTALRLSL
ncbi:GNAT family N-acetyltransferase [Streptacidiphilus jiangxiensis]|uniref:Protein N-acetyltransferase, RimJ/RimL family n=1 Tax=Streptacidiphilus jiangxiensis TaxID=235985 RepID=A0A1H7KP65_STRJI|nr:GNAT family N-acetyltransferase [Streptacidiphilus jiangxiensis]SEK88306.1 Protein N-acetyltransferase, RimJ/RimL family [Streptacidiphilus jiangxiensis]